MVVVAGLLLAGGFGAGVSLAASGGGNGKYPTAAAERAAAEANLPVDEASEARMIAFVDGNPVGRVVKRSLGVQTVTNPRPGRFCVRPTEASGVSPANTVPIVATEYIGTSGFDGLAQWNASRQGCPAGTFSINAFDASEGTPLNDVAFTIVVE
jgi:hypothetical protein